MKLYIKIGGSLGQIKLLLGISNSQQDPNIVQPLDLPKFFFLQFRFKSFSFSISQTTYFLQFPPRQEHIYSKADSSFPLLIVLEFGLFVKD